MMHETLAKFRTTIVLTVVFMIFLGFPTQKSYAQAKKQSPEQRARANLKQLPETTSLLWINSTLRAFSYLKKDDVLSTLLKIYKKPPTTPKDHIRYLTMNIVRQKYDQQNWLKSGYSRRDKPSNAELDFLRKFAQKDLPKDFHAWGTFNSAYLLSQNKAMNSKLISIAKKDKSVIRRAAIIEAMAYAKDDQFIELAKILIPKSLKISNKYQKAILVESLAWSIARYSSQWYRPKPVPKKVPVKKALPNPKKTPKNPPKTPVKPPKKTPKKTPKKEPVKPVVKKMSAAELAKKKAATELLLQIIDLVDSRKILERSRREISLALQYCFKSKFAYEDPESWK